MSSDRKKGLFQPNRTRAQTLPTRTQGKTSTSEPFRRWFKFTGLGHLLVGIWAISGAIATTGNWLPVQTIERKTQTFFFQLRVPMQPPKNIVILAIDDESISQGKLYQSNPEQLAHLEPIQSWAWKREAYAIAVERLMSAGARAVGLDLIFDAPSSYGSADDEKLRRVLQKYAGRVTLAATYESDDKARTGKLTQLAQPGSFLQTNPMSVGSVNYPIEPDGRIHRLASEFPKLLAQQYSEPELVKQFSELVATVPSFDEAILQAARLSYPKPKGDNIFFYGPVGTFEVIPFWSVLDPNNWNTYLQKGQYFKDKIVLVGPTATLLHDFHSTPFSSTWLYAERMSGIEVHANAIATLLEGRSIAEAIPHPGQRGFFVFIGVIGAGFLITRIKNLPIRMGLAAGVVLAWGGISCGLFIFGRLILPTAVPMGAIALSTLSYVTIGSIRDYFSKRHFRRTLKRYSSSPIVKEMISQHDEFEGLLDERELEVLKITLAARYKIIERLSAGGFGETYIAQDTQRPGHPRCVVKQLRPASDNPKIWMLARRLFVKEAEILERLGKHEQIPQLLAHFEEAEEFYLVEEFISGRPLTSELPKMVPLEETKVIAILRDVLQVLAFVHAHGVIHRDIKPDNIIRRQSDGKLVLIDFGAVKELSNQLGEGQQKTEATIGIGTKGYTPSEQAAGNPKYNSDIYALGIIAIQFLTLAHPTNLPSNPKTGEVIWEDKATVSPELATILKKMVCYNFRDRYQSAIEVLEALQPLIATLPPELASTSEVTNMLPTHLSPLSEMQYTTQYRSETATPENEEESTEFWSESSTAQDEEDSTKFWSESSTAQDEEDSTKFWSESSTTQDEEDSTKLWSESSTTQDEEDSTKLWSESSTAQDEEDSTKFWSESSTTQDEEDSTQF